MSIGNLKTDGGKGTNWPWQYRVLLGLDKIAQTLKKGSEFESQLVSIDCSANPSPPPSGSNILRLEVRVWDTDDGGFTSVQLYEIGSDTPDLTDYSGCTKTYVHGDATEATLELCRQLLVTIDVDTNQIEINTSPVIGVTPTLDRVAVNTGSPIVAGARSVSIANVGTEDGLVLGTVLSAGETITFDAGSLNNTLGAITYDPTSDGVGVTATTFLIATLT